MNSMTGDFMNENKDFDMTITELKKEVQYIKDRYDAPVELLERLVREVNYKLVEQSEIITGLHEELNSYEDEGVPAILNPNFVTTPFSDDLGTEDNYCYPRELGEVHDTFNVEINKGSGNPITLTRQDDGSYLQSMVDVFSRLKNDS